MKEKKKVKFVGFWDGFNPKNCIIWDILNKNFDVEICEDPDFIICNVWNNFEYCKYPQVRILLEGENITPDFNIVDYAITPYPIDFLDRNCAIVGGVEAYLRKQTHMDDLVKKDRNYSDSFLKGKTVFATFISAHESENNIRGDFFKKLCKYKEVDSVGTYLCNRPNIKTTWFNNSKTDYQRKGKFALCFESTKSEGFITEKIVDAFYADTIPIYYGSSTVNTVFNEKAFINCTSFPNFDAVIDKIIELDNDDDKYMEMMRQPIFVNRNFPELQRKRLEEYIIKIFSQSPKQACRRPHVLWGGAINSYLENSVDLSQTSSKFLIGEVIKRIKKKIFRKK